MPSLTIHPGAAPEHQCTHLSFKREDKGNKLGKSAMFLVKSSLLSRQQGLNEKSFLSPLKPKIKQETYTLTVLRVPYLIVPYNSTPPSPEML